MTKAIFNNSLLAITAFAGILTMQTNAHSANDFSFNDVRFEAGVLTCNVAGGEGLIFGSEKEMMCYFMSYDESIETYVGSVKKFGIDIGETKSTTISWTVLTPTTELGIGSLEGEYGGLSLEATVGVGGGANVLLGGFDKSIALQPLSGQIQEGYNIAGGIGTISLKSIN